MFLSGPIDSIPDITELRRQCVYALHKETNIINAPGWFLSSLADFSHEVGHPEYPCHFGRRALERGELFVTPIAYGDYRPLAGRLATFLDYIHPTPQRRQVLAAFVEPDPTSDHGDHDRTFWGILNYLHDHDDVEWPAEFATDPTSPAWEFCFHGTAMFVFAAAPTHRHRQSRNLGNCLVLLFQPRNVFIGIEGGTRAGKAARRRIRDRLAKWDTAPPHPAMGDYGDSSNFEWRQYFISEGQNDLHRHCPFLTGKMTRSTP